MGVDTVDRGLLLTAIAVVVILVIAIFCGGITYLHNKFSNEMEEVGGQNVGDPLPGIADITTTGVDQHGCLFYQPPGN